MAAAAGRAHALKPCRAIKADSLKNDLQAIAEAGENQSTKYLSLEPTSKKLQVLTKGYLHGWRTSYEQEKKHIDLIVKHIKTCEEHGKVLRENPELAYRIYKVINELYLNEFKVLEKRPDDGNTQFTLWANDNNEFFIYKLQIERKAAEIPEMKLLHEAEKKLAEAERKEVEAGEKIKTAEKAKKDTDEALRILVLRAQEASKAVKEASLEGRAAEKETSTAKAELQEARKRVQLANEKKEKAKQDAITEAAKAEEEVKKAEALVASAKAKETAAKQKAQSAAQPATAAPASIAFIKAKEEEKNPIRLAFSQSIEDLQSSKDLDHFITLAIEKTEKDRGIEIEDLKSQDNEKNYLFLHCFFMKNLLPIIDDAIKEKPEESKKQLSQSTLLSFKFMKKTLEQNVSKTTPQELESDIGKKLVKLNEILDLIIKLLQKKISK
jgi:hypothetical protein